MNVRVEIKSAICMADGPVRLLALDTASGQCSVALLLDGQIFSSAITTARDHAQLLLPMVDAVLAHAGQSLHGLDGIAFGRGPGSFTGVRIAASVAQGLALGAGLSVLAVSDLRALAEAARAVAVSDGATGANQCLLACMDARMRELYWGVFRSAMGRVGAAVGGERLTSPGGLSQALHGLLPADEQLVGAAGMGLAAYPALVTELKLPAAHCLAHAEPHAAEIALLAASDVAGGADWQDPAAAQPVYLREKVVHAPL